MKKESSPSKTTNNSKTRTGTVCQSAWTRHWVIHITKKTASAYNATLVNPGSTIQLNQLSFGCCRIYLYINVLQNHVQAWVYFKTTCTGTGLQKQTLIFKTIFVLCKGYFWIISLCWNLPSISPQHIPTKQRKKSTKNERIYQTLFNAS